MKNKANVFILVVVEVVNIGGAAIILSIKSDEFGSYRGTVDM